MKRITLFLYVLVAFLCIAQSANAQYATSLHRAKGNLADSRGLILSDNDVLNLTYHVGATPNGFGLTLRF